MLQHGAIPVLPQPRPGAAQGQAPRPGREADQRACGLPGGLLPDWREVFLAAFEQALGRYRSFGLFLDACTRCGACAGACPYFLGTGDPLNIPAQRADLARVVHQSFFAAYPARIKGLLRPREVLTEDLLRRWYTYFHQCSGCRRCAQFCPMGIDTWEITIICREILAHLGLSTEAIAGGVAQTYRTGNHLGAGPRQWSRACAALEERLKNETSVDIKCPVDEYGAEVLLIAPAADLIHNPNVFAGYAKVFHAAGVSWTTSSYASDAEIYGAYQNYRNLRLIYRRVLEAARELKPSVVVWGEAGHGWRAAKQYGPDLDENWAQADFLEVQSPIHIIDWTHHFWLGGAFDRVLDKDASQGLVVTYHDPCHTARSCGLTAQPRALIRAACHRFHDMPSHTIKEQTLCCGGGGGLTGPEERPIRLAGFLPRAQALDQVQKQHGCNWVATACSSCRQALSDGLRHYGLAYGSGGVLELMGRAMYTGGPTKAAGSE